MTELYQAITIVGVFLFVAGVFCFRGGNGPAEPSSATYSEPDPFKNPPVANLGDSTTLTS